MPRETFLPLTLTAPGTQRALRVLDFGPADATPLIYLQASIHADEIPALATAHRLEQRLTQLEAEGAFRGRVRLVPVANPVGLDQHLMGQHLGRFEFSSRDNFNRGYPELGDVLPERLKGVLTDDPDQNVRVIREAIRAVLAERPPVSAPEEHKRLLFEQALDADLIVDLHCDDEAELHLYTSPSGWDAFESLARLLHIPVVMLADDSGGASFDEALPGLWTALQQALPEAPLPSATRGCTVELRGMEDVRLDLIEQDTEAILAFLQRQQVLEGAEVPLPEPVPHVVPLEAVDFPAAPVAGIVLWHKQLGEEVTEGEPLAEIWVPGQASQPPISVRARCSGRLFVRTRQRFVEAGASLGKICSAAPLPWRKGYLLNA